VKPMEIRRQIAGLYHSSLLQANTDHPFNQNILKHKNLRTNYSNASPTQSKTQTLCHIPEISGPLKQDFIPGMNPFDKHEFTKDIPNPDTRKEAITIPDYKVYYDLKTYKK
jgi:hypothetical protein